MAVALQCTHASAPQVVVIVQLPQGLLVPPVGAPPDRAAGHKGDNGQAKAPVQAPHPFPLDDLLSISCISCWGGEGCCKSMQAGGPYVSC